jgi:hypothetical protein
VEFSLSYTDLGCNALDHGPQLMAYS